VRDLPDVGVAGSNHVTPTNEILEVFLAKCRWVPVSNRSGSEFGSQFRGPSIESDSAADSTACRVRIPRDVRPAAAPRRTNGRTWSSLSQGKLSPLPSLELTDRNPRRGCARFNLRLLCSRRRAGLRAAYQDFLKVMKPLPFKQFTTVFWGWADRRDIKDLPRLRPPTPII
jgi:hypothetical protein